jgi:dCMP deaminase
VNIAEATLYTTHSPCIICSKMIINAGIRRIVYLEGYPDALATEMLGESGIEISAYATIRVQLPGDSM